MSEPLDSRDRFRLVRLPLALAYAVATLLYTAVWMIAVYGTVVELGFESSFLPAARALLMTRVAAGSPAERAGLRPGDRIIAIEGKPVTSETTLPEEWSRHRPGDRVRLTIARSGQPAPLALTGVFREQRRWRTQAEYVARQLNSAYPIPFVIVGLAVLFLRLGDGKVWLLSLLFGSFATTQGFPPTPVSIPSALRLFATAYQALMLSTLGALFYWLFAVFPARSALDRRIPWLKWAAVILGLACAYGGLRGGGIRIPEPLGRLLPAGVATSLPVSLILVFIALGLVEFAAHFFTSADRESQRRLRVVFWGTVAGVGPALVDAALRNLAGWNPPLWLVSTLTAVSFLFPVSFAYAVLKHRVLEIPVLLKRSARYLLVQRGFLFLLSLVSIGLTLLFAISFPAYLHVSAQAQPVSITLGAAFGTVLMWGGSQVHKRVGNRIDRAFFRSAYDARVILEDLAEATRTASDHRELAGMLDRHLRQALQPSFLTIYFREGPGMLRAAARETPVELQVVPADLEAAGRKLAILQPDCVVPILGRRSKLEGLLVLGPRLSEEPYSGEDRRLLASVASQTGAALDNMRLAGEIAERMETERRAAREMEIAREVQGRLLPQQPPELKTLECAAKCIQARSVGGDYYDFLDLGPGRVGFVLADVSGKGVHAALLMANLQAHLRSQSGIAPGDPALVLGRVNRLMWKSTGVQHFATLFLGIYDDSSRRLAYVNCGHNPPMLSHGDGSVERLEATATVIGAFERWDCSVGETAIAAGDVLAVFSDGVSEAAGVDDEEFGEARLLDEIASRREMGPGEIIDGILSAVERFCGAGVQSDDLTLLVLRGRSR